MDPRLKENKDFYTSPKWRRVRQAILRRDKFICQRCKRFGRVRAATEVHHIEYLEDNPSRAYDPTNLVSLCHACHNHFHFEKSKNLNNFKEHSTR